MNTDDQPATTGSNQSVNRRFNVQRLSFSPAEFAFIVATRAALGAGVGLLLSQKLPEQQRRSIGFTLLTIGILTTIPAALALYSGREAARLAA